MAYATGIRAVEIVNEDLKPSDILTRAAFENAIVACSAIGGSTNAPIHLNAIAKHIGVPLSIADWENIGFDVPLLVNMQPAGEYLGEAYHRAGGVGAIFGELMQAGKIRTGAMTASGATVGENYKDARSLDTKVIRTYDQPLLETRFRMVRQRTPFSSMEHLDLLFGARRLWNLRFDSCRLVELENQILGVERHGDLPGEMIPYVYFEYVRTQEIFRLMPVFHHNAIDILTLACLTAIVPRAFHAPGQSSMNAEFSHGAEIIGLARWWRQAEQHENALAMFRQAIGKNLSDELMFRTLWDIAALEKKLGREDAALPVLTDLAASRNPWRAAALVELAKYYERRERNFALALEMTRRAMELEPSEALERRAARLEKRVAVPKTSRLI